MEKMEKNENPKNNQDQYYQPFLKSLAIEDSTETEILDAKTQMIQLCKEFKEFLELEQSASTKIDKIKQRFATETDSDKLNNFIGTLSQSEINDLYKVAMLGEFFWEEKKFIHEQIYIFNQGGKENFIQNQKKYIEKYGRNNIEKTLKSKIGDCNRLGTIILTIALVNGIKLNPYFCEAHFSTAIILKGEIIQLETGDGKLYFEKDFKDKFPYKAEEGNFKLGTIDDIYFENLRDEFAAIIENPTSPDEKEIKRLKKIGDELLLLELPEKLRKTIEEVYKFLKIPIKPFFKKITDFENSDKKEEIKKKLIYYIETNLDNPIQKEVIKDSISDFKVLFEQAFSIYSDLHPEENINLLFDKFIIEIGIE
jgi:hypothetical protein